MKCPNCGEQCERDEVDNGVGMEAVGPWGCPDCHWFEQPLTLERPENWPLQSFDARDWATAFCDIYEQNHGTRPDEGWMITWFANALMRGFDEATRRRDVEVREFIGWLSADIPELHHVEVPRLADSYDRFRQRSSEATAVGAVRSLHEEHRTLKEAAPMTQEPPQHIIDLAVEVSGWSPCQSKRGVVVFRGDDVVSHGHNFKPRGFECDGSDTCKATCRTEAVHAEQVAIIAACGRPKTDGADLLHVKSIGGQLVASGGPSCVPCSTLMVAYGIAGVWLYHADGWRRYEATDFHRRSLAATLLPRWQAEHDHIRTPREEKKYQKRLARMAKRDSSVVQPPHPPREISDAPKLQRRRRLSRSVQHLASELSAVPAR